MRRTASSRLWRHVGAALHTLHEVARPGHAGSTGTHGNVRTDGGTATRPDRDRTDQPAETGEADHLRDVPDGAGCTEIWEYLSERSATEREADD